MNYQSINPANGQINATIESVSDAQAVNVAKKVRDAFTTFKNLTLKERTALMQNLAATLRAKKNEYSRLMTIEMGKPVLQAQAECDKCAWTADVYADHAQEWLKEKFVSADGQKNVVRFEPLGVVLAIMPWNYPFWQLLRVAIPTMLAGNTMVLRHSNNVPLCAQALETLFQEAGFPKNAFRTVITAHSAVNALIDSPHVQGISFTGSEHAGKMVGRQAGSALKPLVLELGGSDAFIVLDDANLEKAVDAAVFSRTQNAGQSCIAAKRFIVLEKIAAPFTDLFTEKMASLQVGDPMDKKTHVGPLSSLRQRDEVKSQVDDSIKNGAKALCGGTIPNNLQSGAFYAPTVLSQVRPGMRVMDEEVFGPVAPVFIVKSEAEAVHEANRLDLGLGGSVWTENRESGEKIARQIETGAIFVNAMTKSDPRMPFGGIKKSGFGRELGPYGMQAFCNIKAYNIY